LLNYILNNSKKEDNIDSSKQETKQNYNGEDANQLKAQKDLDN
jgi:hypothetical protein